MNLFDVSGRVVVVTGANGRLGRQFVRSLSAAGAKVAALDLHEVPRARELDRAERVDSAHVGDELKLGPLVGV